MNDTIKVICENGFGELEVPMGTPLLEVAERLTPGLHPFLAAFVNNRIKELSYKIYAPVTIRFVDITSFAGIRVYQRTAWFLLQKAVRDLYPGQTLVIAYDDTPTRTLAVNAYSYPFIRGGLLDAALPYLTYLTPFTYGINADGTLLPLADEWLLTAAGQYRTAALMHLSTLTEEGRFDNARSTLILEDADAQDALVQSILETVQARHYFGLDVDFEYVLPEQREAYAAFITRLREALNPLGCPVIVALAPKTSAAQRGLLYEAHDYALLGAAANAVFLMTYEWGYTYGPPMAVAPLGQVRAVLDYALTAVAPEKIFMGIPLYGYDWPLPFVSGETRAESLSPVQAVERALRHDIAIQYDADAQAPYYHYTDRGGREHAVWFEDARSIEAKLRLADEYHLQGVGYWNLTRPFPQNWAVLASLFDIETLL